MRVEVFDGKDIDEMIGGDHPGDLGSSISTLLGYGSGGGRSSSRVADMLRRPRHALRTLLSHLELIHIAHQRGLRSVMILEADVRPLGGANGLSSAELEALGARLHQPWDVLRAGGLYRNFSVNRRAPTECPAACRCKPLATLESVEGSRLCEVAVHAQTLGGSRLYGLDRSLFCDVRETVAYAVSATAFPAFLRARQRALVAIQHAAAAQEGTATHHASNGSFGLPTDDFGAPVDLPWIDIWLPAAFDAIHVLPSLTVQQTKQDTLASSQRFALACAGPRAAAYIHRDGWKGAERKGARLEARTDRTQLLR